MSLLTVPYKQSSISLVIAGCLVPLLFSTATVTQAQELRRSSSNILMEEVTVTARKREEAIKDVPLSITAFNGDQLETLKIRDLTNLAVTMPNVALDDIGTSRGVANFSIRGLGVNSSIPQLTPPWAYLSMGFIWASIAALSLIPSI